jgi:DNA-binding response OmpR family regulator
MIAEKKRILLVDDDMDMLEQLRMQCEKLGYQTITAESQKEGEEVLQTEKPDLAIVDLMMEQEDSGFILSYKLKKKYPEVPVIIVTGVTKETGMIFGLETEEEQNWIKADKYLEKGLRPDQLQREIKKLLKE